MTRTKKLMTAAAVAAVLIVAASVVAGATTGSPGHPADNKVIHVVEHAISDTVQQFHPPADSVGDMLGFHNPVFNRADTEQVGTDNGSCVRTVATGKTEWECMFTTSLSGGSLTVEGPFYDDGTDTTLAITGGTGRFTRMDGSMLLHATGDPVGSEFDFVFTLTNASQSRPTH